VPLKRAIVVLALVAMPAAAARRALLVGINDYTASRLTTIRAAAPERDWPNLSGAVNDIDAMREMIVLLHGFDVVALEDQAATRAAILGAANRLASTASKNDVVFFYFAGHGSQVRNSKSDEPDKLDESIVPADSRRGAPDIRDKELRRIFNAILDRGARLTVMIDACHSGSGARGLLTLSRPRGVHPDLRDVTDGGDYGPRPENRGALVISASHDDEEARETRDDTHAMHGAFTWAWLRAMRDAAADEPAMETFARAQARLRAEMPFQNPVLAGDDAARRRPFLGDREGVRAARTTFAIERVRGDGIAVIAGGWAHGITVGSELRVAGDRTRPPLVVTALLGLGRCEARVPAAARVRGGMLLELSGWAVPSPRPLRVAIPRAAIDVAAFARRVEGLSIADPTMRTPDHVLRRNGGRWELLDRTGHATSFSSDDNALRAIAHLRGAVFVQLPATPELAAQIAGPAVLEVVERAEDADYVLVGHVVHNRIEYAWMRPNVRRGDRRTSGLPLRTTWIAEAYDTAPVLRDIAVRLHRIAAWTFLDAPPEGKWPYRLVLRRDGKLVEDGGKVAGNETYDLELRSKSSTRAGRRHVYVFTIDSYGQSLLVYPVSGSVENHLPLAGETVIPLDVKIAVAPPYGVDTYVVLATDEPLPNPWILQWDGVRGARVLTQPVWSIERFVVESIRPPHKRIASVSLP